MCVCVCVCVCNVCVCLYVFMCGLYEFAPCTGSSIKASQKLSMLRVTSSRYKSSRFVHLFGNLMMIATCEYGELVASLLRECVNPIPDMLRQ